MTQRSALVRYFGAGAPAAGGRPKNWGREHTQSVFNLILARQPHQMAGFVDEE